MRAKILLPLLCAALSFLVPRGSAQVTTIPVPANRQAEFYNAQSDVEGIAYLCYKLQGLTANTDITFFSDTFFVAFRNSMTADCAVYQAASVAVRSNVIFGLRKDLAVPDTHPKLCSGGSQNPNLFFAVATDPCHDATIIPTPPSPSPTATPTPSASPSPTVVPSPSPSPTIQPSPTPSPTPTPTPSVAGLIAYWPMDIDPLTGKVTDVVGGRSGTISGQMTVVVGVNGNALAFTSGAKVALPFADLGNTAYTIALKATTLDTSAYLFGAGDQSDVRIVSEKIFVSQNGSSNTLSTVPIADNAWHSIAVVYTKATTTIYVDGVAGTPRSVAATYVLWLSAIGARSAGETGDFQGSIDDVKVFNRALTAAEIQSL